MAQKSKGRKQAPAYSADLLALRMIAGLALTALGVLIFLAVNLRMTGNIFEGLRRISFGLCGSLAKILAILPLWAGILVIWSSQRKAPVQPWLYGTICFIILSAFIMLISGNAMDHLSRQYGGTWGGVIAGAFQDCASTGTGGGALGVALAWPLWRFLGGVLGIILTFLLFLFSALMIFGLTPARLWGLVTGKAGQRKEEQQRQRAVSEQEQMAWQQEQARQQAAWQQEQARIIARQQQNYPPAVQPPVNDQANRSATGRNTSVEAWQDQMTARMAADQTAAVAPGGWLSRIFGGTPQETSGKETPHRSRIFGRQKEEYDGLSDGSTLAQNAGEQAARQLREEHERRTRRTATGEPIGRPETRWTQGQERFSRKTEEPRIEPQEAVIPEPAEEIRPAPGENPPAEFSPEPEAGARREMKPKTERENPLSVAQDAETLAEELKNQWSAPKNRETRKAPEKRAEQPAAPKVQMTVGTEAYQPAVKLPPKAEQEGAGAQETEEPWTPTPYYAPPMTDLARPVQGKEDTAAEDEMRSRRLEETLSSFRVAARVVHVTHGPAISRFELELASGTKVNKVAELEKDIAYGMEATSVRIEAPIPGKSLVGVEVPNRKVSTVTLREVLESDKMQNSSSILTVALGKDIAGNPIVCDLARMPHMLIAGQTGSGKSVCINTIINSLLFRAGPDEVKMILVDPKVVELQCYNNIPHLLIPVVNDPHKAAAALAWAVAEMMERYDRFAERKVRNLDGYNAVLGPQEKPMSRIVIIIDELADLMMVCKKDVEEYICRLTQLARAAGIHLIVATQRPSVDVITGLIKANIPSRIAFKTSSAVDSRTILDRGGADQLLGWGDMLYLPTGSFAPVRVQGCFLSDEEVNRIAAHVRSANPSTYDPDVLEKLQAISGASEEAGADLITGLGDAPGGDGSLFDQAVEYAINDGQISTSTLQRRLKIGYARAGRLTDEMEERGIIAAKDGSKPRKCLITREEWEEMKKAAEGVN